MGYIRFLEHVWILLLINQLELDKKRQSGIWWRWQWRNYLNVQRYFLIEKYNKCYIMAFKVLLINAALARALKPISNDTVVLYEIHQQKWWRQLDMTMICYFANPKLFAKNKLANINNRLFGISQHFYFDVYLAMICISIYLSICLLAIIMIGNELMCILNSNWSSLQTVIHIINNLIPWLSHSVYISLVMF